MDAFESLPCVCAAESTIHEFLQPIRSSSADDSFAHG